MKNYVYLVCLPDMGNLVLLIKRCAGVLHGTSSLSVVSSPTGKESLTLGEGSVSRLKVLSYGDGYQSMMIWAVGWW